MSTNRHDFLERIAAATTPAEFLTLRTEIDMAVLTPDERGELEEVHLKAFNALRLEDVTTKTP